uniref:Uncharacterized protein n=1 Tax=Hemiselmis tepida TaxID=464990 RepID=A0A7S0Z1T2_9CRYP|mmetsp:Transcript_29771/g.75345  ORF Transcript_29771/g.75345 Transcript_29771/m.75345 type:complete len:226 (+) Transcript_29771:175-852(+)
MIFASHSAKLPAMVCSPIAPPRGDGFGDDAQSRVPSWVRGIAQRNKLHRQILSSSGASAGHATSAPPEHPSTPADPDLYKSLLMRLSHADPSERCLAASLLAEVAPRGDRRALTSLLAVSGHGNATAPSGPPRGVRDTDHGVQVAAIDATGIVAEQTGDERATTVLLTLLKQRDWQLRTVRFPARCATQSSTLWLSATWASALPTPPTAPRPAFPYLYPLASFAY